MKHRTTLPALALITTLVLTGCDLPASPSAIDDGGPVSPDAQPQLRLDPTGTPMDVSGFSTPESALYDPVADLYLVSNVNGHPQILSNDGFISRVTPDGEIDELEWIKGGENGVTLHAPTGMTLVGDVLYVADADALRLFDRATGDPIGSWPVPVRIDEVPNVPGLEWVRGVLLNAVCASPRGEIYLTATGIDISLDVDIDPTGEDVVYRFRSGDPVPIAEGPALMGPNGCIVKGSNVFIAPLLSNEVYRLNPAGRRFHVATLPQGGLDGIVEVGGHVFVSSVFGGSIYRMSAGGSDVTEVLSDLNTPADLGFDVERRRLLIPSLFGDVILIQPLD